VHYTKLGELSVSRIGLGTMGMSAFYTGANADNDASTATIHRALDLGVTFFDTAEIYGPYTNEELLGQALGSRRDEAIVATKWGTLRHTADDSRGLDGSPANLRLSVEGSLRRLGTDHINLYYQHRMDPGTPVEETVGALKELIEAGKIRGYGLSEAATDTIRRAHAVHPVSALQIEYSLMSRGIEAEILPTVRELGIGVTAYGNLSRGLLSTASAREIGPGDPRSRFPRFRHENLRRNLELLTTLEKIAEAKGATTAQLAIAWVASRGSDIVPLIGTKRRDRLAEALGALEITLSPAELAAIEAAVPSGQVAGDRYDPAQMAALDSEKSSA
jgi:aryl-alcohol dehydrogenase-like predicted oxidoreductase